MTLSPALWTLPGATDHTVFRLADSLPEDRRIVGIMGKRAPLARRGGRGTATFHRN